MKMENFTTDNTEGYSQGRLDEINKEFEVWAEKNNFDLKDEQQLKTANDKFFNEVMIHA